MVTGGPNAWSLNCTQPPYGTEARLGVRWIPIGTLFCTSTTAWHPAASAWPATASNTEDPSSNTDAAAPPTRPRLLIGPWCLTVRSRARTMAGEVDDLLERRAVLPVERPGSDDA